MSMNKTVLDCFGKLTTSKIEFKIQEAIIISNKRFNNSARKLKLGYYKLYQDTLPFAATKTKNQLSIHRVRLVNQELLDYL